MNSSCFFDFEARRKKRREEEKKEEKKNEGWWCGVWCTGIIKIAE